MDVLYHYCSNKSFCSIVQERSISLSSLSLSNDSMEGKMVSQIIEKLAEKDGLNREQLSELKESMKILDLLIEGLGFCLSEEGDLLSQWRGYASDASGVSIGFSKKYLSELCDKGKSDEGIGYTLHKVKYEYQEQVELVKPVYNQVIELIKKNGAFDFSDITTLLHLTEEEFEKKKKNTELAFRKLHFKLLELSEHLFLLKHRGFSEEKEWRLLTYLAKGNDNFCDFRPLFDKIVPVKAFSFPKNQSRIIEKVILGPKNITPKYVVENLLKKNGFVGVEVVRAEITYR